MLLTTTQLFDFSFAITSWNSVRANQPQAELSKYTSSSHSVIDSARISSHSSRKKSLRVVPLENVLALTTRPEFFLQPDATVSTNGGIHFHEL